MLIAALLMPVRAAETEDSTAPEETMETTAPAVPDPTLPPETTEPEPIPIDYSNLSYRIAVANGLDPAEYTAESWSILEDALGQARYALYSGYLRYHTNRFGAKLRYPKASVWKADADTASAVLCAGHRYSYHSRQSSGYDLSSQKGKEIPSRTNCEEHSKERSDPVCSNIA